MRSLLRIKLRHSLCRRNKSSLGLWHEDINTDIKQRIEQHWSSDVYSKKEIDPNKKSCYVLPMFPYPSGNLHMGHVRVYSISDTIARLQRLSGMNVIHPIGWDAFGLPAENAAIERNTQPDKWTSANIESMRNQLMRLGFDFDWNRELSTCDPKYYKWTQYIFLKLFEKGLAYQSKATVNWDPVDQTVLADEQVDEQGCSWRSGAKVHKKCLTQWFIKTTKFSKQLLEGLDSKHLDNWRDIINLQKHWIGECNGAVMTFNIVINGKITTIDVWTKEPFRFLHGQFLTISKSHVILQDLTKEESNKLKCFNPLTKCELPVFISDESPYPEGREVYIACTKWDQQDETLARRLNVIPEKANQDIDFDTENQKAITLAKEKNVGGYFVSSKLRDWLISRQRYWGTPIPIIHCPNCGTVPVPHDQLPVQLPDSQSQGGRQTLADYSSWVNCKCPKCNSSARRETDTMDTFVDSSWYYYRFLDPHNDTEPFSKDKLMNTTPVHIYVGGKEHAVLHLYYARFMSYFLHSLGWTPNEEPFKKLVVQGMVMGQSYKTKSSGKYIPSDQVEKVGKDYKEKDTGEPVVVQWEKMSKSKYNGENPERLQTSYGSDLTRLLMLADVPPATARQWSDATLPGVLNWQHRLWLTMRDFLNHRQEYHEHSKLSEEAYRNMEEKLWKSRNYFTATATYHFMYTHQLSVGISRLQGLTSVLRNNVPPEIISKSKEYELCLAAVIIMLSPVTPHFCSELWAGLRSAANCANPFTHLIHWDNNVLDQQWPVVDPHFKLSYLCKVDGADRCELKVQASDLATMSEESAVAMMMSEDSIVKRTRRGVLGTRYELYPGCRAILHIQTNRPPPVKKVQVAETN